MDYEHKLNEILKETGKIQSDIKEIFETEFFSGAIPDKLPPEWGAKRITISIPFDSLEYDNLKNALKKLEPLLFRYKKYRSEQAELLFKMNKTKLEETVPE